MMHARARHFTIVALVSLCTLHACPARGQLLSPGELSHVHEKLEGDAHCLECHTSEKRVAAPRCHECHGDIGRELQNGTGLHGRNYRSKPCAECHVEHRGKQHDLVHWPGGARDELDHRLTGWALVGKHAQVACAKCHTTNNARGAASYIGLETECNGCHQDPHDQRFGDHCQKCHNAQAWKITSTKLTAFDHALTRFPLRGQHIEVDCKSCHGAPPDTKYRPLAFDTCLNCHQDPHWGHFGNACTTCHSETDWKQLSMQRSDHPGLSLSDGHEKVRCVTCHDRGTSHAPSQGTHCVSCHAPIHEAPFGHDCARCHETIDWLGVRETVGLESHGRTAFALLGAHRKVACDECHGPWLPLNQRFRKLSFGHCTDCHLDAHAGEFRARNGGDCTGCHDEHGFVPTLFGQEAHASTAFSLVGRHQAVACVACHAAVSEHANQAGVSGRRMLPTAPGAPKARLDWRLPKQQCAECHANPHGDQFAHEMSDGGCAHCHTPNAWSLPNVDHSIWPLTGAHTQTPCAACHVAADKASRASYRGVSRQCEACHDDPHAGQFRLQEPVRSCTSCHDTRTFPIEQFDHAVKAGYALEGQHLRVPCAGCHRAEQLRNGASAVRYRLTYQSCADCHKNPHGTEPRP
jgi:hypothetical protein